MRHVACSVLLAAWMLCSCAGNASKRRITAEMAYEGVSNYCHSEYGTTRMVEYVPTLDVNEDAGTINLFDYLKKD